MKTYCEMADDKSLSSPQVTRQLGPSQPAATDPNILDLRTTETHMAGRSFPIWFSYTNVNATLVQQHLKAHSTSMTLAAAVTFQTQVSTPSLTEDIAPNNLKQPSWRRNMLLYPAKP